MFSQIIELGFDVDDDTLPLFNEVDDMVDNDCLFKFDFDKRATWESQESPGDLAVVKNLVPGGADGVVHRANSGINFVDGAMKFEGVAGNYIDLGDSANLASLGSTANVLFVMRMKRDVGFSSAHYQRVLGRASTRNGAGAQWVVHLGAGGSYLVGNVTTNSGNASSEAIANLSTNPTLGEFVQWGFAFEGGVSRIYKNGVVVATGSVSAEAFNNPAGLHTLLGGSPSGELAPLKASIRSVAGYHLVDRTAAEILADDSIANQI